MQLLIRPSRLRASSAPPGSQSGIRTATRDRLDRTACDVGSMVATQVYRSRSMAYSTRGTVISALYGHNRVGAPRPVRPARSRQQASRTTQSPARVRSRSPRFAERPMVSAKRIESHGVQRVGPIAPRLFVRQHGRPVPLATGRRRMTPHDVRLLNEARPSGTARPRWRGRVVDRSLVRPQRRDDGRWVAAARRDEKRRTSWLQRIAHVSDKLLVDSGVDHLPDERRHRPRR